MKRIVLIAAAAFLSFAAHAQELKFACVNFTEIVQLMPEMEQAMLTMEANEKANNELLREMYEEYQVKGQQYQQKASTWTPAIRESKEKEIMDLQARLEQTQQSLQAELQEVQSRLHAPIIEKAQKVVSELAAAKGCAAVFEKGQLLYLDTTKIIDLTPEARVALNIPEGRTLEQLQQELMARAQAAQQGM